MQSDSGYTHDSIIHLKQIINCEQRTPNERPLSKLYNIECDFPNQSLNAFLKLQKRSMEMTYFKCQFNSCGKWSASLAHTHTGPGIYNIIVYTCQYTIMSGVSLYIHSNITHASAQLYTLTCCIVVTGVHQMHGQCTPTKLLQNYPVPSLTTGLPHWQHHPSFSH